MRTRTSVTVFITASILLLAGCPPANKQELGPCKKVGDSCEISPGKLGTCVANDICEKPPCGLVCQSQH